MTNKKAPVVPELKKTYTSKSILSESNSERISKMWFGD
tara:strand:- start:115 stop:228 length:114 start_codon:yes stop_codon:yes gene_type:complete